MDSQPNQQQPKHDRSRTRWTATLDELFVDVVLQQVLQGNRRNNSFSKMTWKTIREEFNKQTGLEFDKKQLKKHLDVLRNRYDNVKSQLTQNGLGGEQSRHMLMTGVDLWDDYIEDYPIGERTRIKDVPFYDQLCKIFAEPSSIGRYAQSSHYVEIDKETVGTEAPQPSLHPKEAGMSADPQIPTLAQDDSSSRSGVDVNLDVQNKPKPVSNSCKRKRNNNEFEGAIAEALMEVGIASKLRAEAMIQSVDQFSITKCITVLDEMGEIDQSLYLIALDLFDKPDRREIFLSLKSDKRLTWLQGKFNCSSA